MRPLLKQNACRKKNISASRIKLFVLGFKLLVAMTLVLNAGLTFALEDAVCAGAKIEIVNELTMERQAFDATMRINNNLEAISIADINVSVIFMDELGVEVLASSDPNTKDPNVRFFITIDRYTGIDGLESEIVSGIDPSAIIGGSVLPGVTAEINWLIIPAAESAGASPVGTLYFVGASLDYTIGGEPEHVSVAPDFITVRPLPLLTLDYFLTKEVFADDAFTPYEEPPEPFTFGVRVQNNGAARADAVKIESIQPQLAANELGLLINFSLIGSSVDGQYISPSLNLDFGSLDAGAAKVGRWQMITNISGQLVDVAATFTHADSLGGQLTSLIQATNGYSLIRDVLVDLPGRDAVRDFLAYDGSLIKVFESDNLDTQVTDQTDLSSLSGSSPGPGVDDVVHTFTMPSGSGLSYVKLTDEYNGSRYVKSATRLDGKPMSLDNIWFSKSRIEVSPGEFSWNYYLNVFDVNSTGSYTLVFGLRAGGLAPVINPVAEQLIHEENLVTFDVTATDPEGEVPVLTATEVPAGATFDDNANGSATFTWTPGAGTAGIYTVILTASDGSLTSNSYATVKVFSDTSDIDGDGMADGWEVTHFGNLDRDGTGDADSDGITDLNEFLAGTNPNVATPAAPLGVTATAGLNTITLEWLPVTGAISYNLYWSVTTGVDKTTGTQMLNVTSPFAHTGLNSGATYHHVVTTVTAADESAVSAEVSATTTIERAWELPVVLTGTATALGADFESQIAVDDNGNAIAVWTQCIATDCLWVSRYTPAGGWTAPEAVAGEDVAGPKVVMEADGNSTVMWMVTDALGSRKQLWARRYVAGVWETSVLIQDATALNGHMDYPAGIDVLALPVGNIVMPEGGLIAAWSLWEDPNKESVYFSIYKNGTGWEAPVYFKPGHSPRQVMDAAGNVTIILNYVFLSQYHSVLYRQWVPGYEIYCCHGGGVDPINYSDINSPADIVLPSSNQGLVVWKELNETTTDTYSYFARTFDGTIGTSNTQSIGLDASFASHLAGLDTDGAGNFAVALTDPMASGGGTLRYYSAGLSTWNNWEMSTKLSSLKIGGRSTNTIMDASGHASVLQISAENGLWASRFNLKTNGLRDLEEEYVSNYIDGENGISGMSLAKDSNNEILTLGRREDGHVQVSRYKTFATPPKSIVSGPVSVDEGAVAVLDGGSSTDVGGDIVSYEWKQVRGAPASLGVTNTSSLSFTTPVVYTLEDQKLIFALITVDGDDAIATRLHEVTVNPIKAGGLSPVINPVPDQVVYENQLLSFAVTSSDPEAVLLTLTTDPLPTGATFTHQANGAGSFLWTPTTLQVGVYTVQVTASDGSLNTTVSVSISVINTTSDVDADGMTDNWEITHFGNLAKDGTGDTDRDGLSDMQEFAGETDPNNITADAPTNLTAKTGEFMTQLSWTAVSGATGYNLYWSTSPGVTKATGTQVLNVTNPYIHDNVSPASNYYYGVTAVIPTDESATSDEVSVTTPFERAWQQPVQLTSTSTSLAAEFVSQIDVADNGNAIAVWTQCIATDCLWASHYTPAGGWTIPQAIASGNVASPRVKLGEDGNAIVVWLIEDGANSKKEIWARTYLSGVWQTAQLLQDATLFVSGHYDVNPGPDVILNLDGTALVAWNLWESPDSYKIYTTHHHVGSGWEAPRYHRTGYIPRQSIDSVGKAVLSYYADKGSTPLTYMIYVDFWSDNVADDKYFAGGTGPATNLRFMDFNDPHEIIMHGNRKAMVAWKDYADTNNNSFHYAVSQLNPYWSAEYRTAAIPGLGSHMGGIAVLDIDSVSSANHVMPVVDPFDPAGGSFHYKISTYTWSWSSGLSSLAVSDYSTASTMDSAANAMVVQMTEGPGLWSIRYSKNTDLTRGYKEQYVGNYIDGNNGVLGLSLDIGDNDVIQLIGRRENGHVYVSQYKAFNSPPKVVITGPASADESALVVLDGTGSTDAGADIVSYEWQQVRGPAVTLTGVNAATLNFTMPVYDVNDASMVFTLVIVDADGAIGSAIHEITNVDLP